MRLVNFMFDGSAATYSCKGFKEDSDEEGQPGQSLESDIRSYVGNIDKLIQRSDLPKEVKLPINFFEKATNIFKDSNLRSKLNFSGDLVTYFKTSRATFE